MYSQFPGETLYGYPVASQFHCQAEAALTSATPRSHKGPLAVYIHVPFCCTICHFCGFTRTNKFTRRDLERSTRGTLQELDLLIERLNLRDAIIGAVFFGGGTASTLDLDQVKRLVTGIRERFTIASDAEWTFEGECMTLSRPGYLSGLADLGFGRVSFGVQTTDEGARRVLNLIPSMTQLVALARQARASFDEVCADFIYGWPGQTPSAAVRDLGVLCDALEITSLDLFQFEKLDAHPTFMNYLYEAGLQDPPTATLQATRRALVDRLATHGFTEKSYTYFEIEDGPQRAVSYGQCYYGFDDAGVIGAGRGAQSFYGGLMWGNALPYGTWCETVEQGRLPIASFGQYLPFERELVSWARRGHIVRAKIDAFGWPELRLSLERLVEEGLIEENAETYRLTAIGRDWVPCLMEEFMPTNQRLHYHRETSRFEALIVGTPA